VVEPVFDNTLLYWYPPDNELGLYSAFRRTIPDNRQRMPARTAPATNDLRPG
jgi:hypothetical protein